MQRTDTPGDVDVEGEGLNAPIGDLSALLQHDGPPLQVESQDPVTSVCRKLLDRGVQSCLVRPPNEGGDFRLFRLTDLCSALLDALRADPVIVRVLKVLGASAVCDVVQKDAARLVDASTPLVDLLSHLVGKHGETLLVAVAGNLAPRIFGPGELLELLMRHGRTCCPALRHHARALVTSEGGQTESNKIFAKVTDSTRRCLEDLKAYSISGLAVLAQDGSIGSTNESVFEHVLGMISPSNVLAFFVKPPEEASKLVTANAHDFVLHELQEIPTPRKHGQVGSLRDTRYPFVHADVEQTVEVVASKLLASRAPCVAVCSEEMREVRAIVSAHDIVQYLQGHLHTVRFHVERDVCRVPSSPRIWPSCLVKFPDADGKPEDNSRQPCTDGHQCRVSWIDEMFGNELAEILEFPQDVVSPTAGRSPVLALTDAPADMEPGDAIVLPTAFRAISNRHNAEDVEGENQQSAVALASSPKNTASDLDDAFLPLEAAHWQHVSEVVKEGVPPRGGHRPCLSGLAQATSYATEQLQLVLYQHRDLVLYDRKQNQAFARRIPHDQAIALTKNRHTLCPLCRQHLDPSWAFVVDGYFDILSNLPTSPSASSSSNAGGGDFKSNEEAVAAAGLHSIPSGILNCGYYKRFFVEEKKLGAGSFGAVYLCRHQMDEIDLGVFALKKLALGDDTKRLRQVVREVKALERLRHVNIIDYKHSWLEIDRHSAFCPWVPFLFILMEYCNAGSLEDLIWPSGFVRGGSANASQATILREELIWRLFLDVCRGLRHLHSRSILHRDLKPSNILLHIDEVTGDNATAEGRRGSSAPRALLSDFGTCEILGDGALREHVHGGYAIEFMAPERLRGEESDEPADMWSAGLVLYAMCYGDLPYHSEDPAICREKVVAHTVLADLPDFRAQALRGLISGLTARSPVARPTAEETEHAVWQALYQHCGSDGAAPRSPHAARATLPPPPLELLDAAASPAATPTPPGTAETEPPAKILRVASESSLISAETPGPPNGGNLALGIPQNQQT